MLTLQQLRDHALANPTKQFPINHCSLCLAGDLLNLASQGLSLQGHYDYRLPRAFSELTQRLAADPSRESELIDGQWSRLYTGAELAPMIETLIQEEATCLQAS